MTDSDEWTRKAVQILEARDRPLFAPTEEVLEIYRREVLRANEKNPDQVNALILGMTPELADLALQDGCLVFRVDHNPKMIEFARERQKVTDVSRDIVIQGDWLDMHMIEDGEMDLVLGDASLNNVPHAQMSRLLDELLRVTHRGSVFAFKQFVIPDKPIESHEFDNIMSFFRKGKLSIFDLFRILHFYSFISDAYNPLTRELHASKAFDALNRKHEEEALTDEEFELIKSKNWNIVHTIYRYTEQKQILRRLGPCRVLLPGDRPMYQHMHVFSIERE